MTPDIIQEIELNIQQAQKLVELGNSLERLKNNRDFKKVILEGLFQNEAVRLVHLKASKEMQSPDKQEFVIKQLDSIGLLSQYFQNLSLDAAIAAKTIGVNEETRDEILNEGIE